MFCRFALTVTAFVFVFFFVFPIPLPDIRPDYRAGLYVYVYDLCLTTLSLNPSMLFRVPQMMVNSEFERM